MRQALLLASALLISVSPAGAQEAEPADALRSGPTSNFHAVGFDVDTGDYDAFRSSILKLTKTCRIIKLDEANAVCFQQKDNGGQIWIGLREAGEGYDFITANPAFIGKSAFPVRVEGVQSNPEWEPFEYRLAVTFSDTNIPLLVALADPREAARFRDLSEPQDLTLDVTAFTFNPEIFEDEDAFFKAQAKLGEGVTYTADYFIPSGLFGDETSARATFGGEILEAERLTTRDGSSHWRTLVRVQGGGTMNVVFDDVWPDLTPKVGRLISGAFWLSAQVPDAP
ncbi:MAG: hypothetical protein AAF291_00150 [Pseudomonadota bacterium]